MLIKLINKIFSRNLCRNTRHWKLGKRKFWCNWRNSKSKSLHYAISWNNLIRWRNLWNNLIKWNLWKILFRLAVNTLTVIAC